MGRQRLPKRANAPLSRLKCCHYVIISFVTCFAGFSAFSVSYYASSTYLRETLSHFFSAGPLEIEYAASLRDLFEFYKSKNFPGKVNSINIDYYLKYNDFDYRIPQSVTYTSAIYNDNIEILFRLPQKTAISAILIIFHSCRHTAHDWFYTYERQRIIGAAIDLGYACLVFQATNNSTRCWSNKADIHENKDVKMVFKGLDGFYKEYPNLALLPIFTFGSSSGGLFSSIFVTNQRYRIHGQALFISIIHPEILYTRVKANKYPSTVWIRMLRDIEFASEDRINTTQQIFIEEKISVNTLIIEPVRMARTTFRERIPSLSASTSHYLFNRLRGNRWLNGRSYLMYNPRRRFEWQEFLFPPSIDDSTTEEIFNDLKKHKDQIIELLNTIYAEHEISYERSYEALKWLKDVYDQSKTRTVAAN
ncbi:unnamed protein product [Rotaria magnacalcarata]|uniref:Uncharacterized protein n=2 Tax=Rotaria magnacalcarata TaxID=392030 RepID=A0A816LGB3_9BILA|nr:unnamed protein product [Rotaria magnacalcarata]